MICDFHRGMHITRRKSELRQTGFPAFKISLRNDVNEFRRNRRTV
jgi:hypothetical protein